MLIGCQAFDSEPVGNAVLTFGDRHHHHHHHHNKHIILDSIDQTPALFAQLDFVAVLASLRAIGNPAHAAVQGAS